MRREVSREHCQVCQRPDVEALDERLALDMDTVRSMAGSEGLSFAHVWFHRARHLPLDLAAAASEMSKPISREQLLNFGVRGMHLMRSISADPDERSRTRSESENTARGWADTIAKNLLTEVDPAAESSAVSVQVIALLREGIDARPELAAVVPILDQVMERLAIEADR